MSRETRLNWSIFENSNKQLYNSLKASFWYDWNKNKSDWISTVSDKHSFEVWSLIKKINFWVPNFAFKRRSWPLRNDFSRFNKCAANNYSVINSFSKIKKSLHEYILLGKRWTSWLLIIIASCFFQVTNRKLAYLKMQAKDWIIVVRIG